MKLRNNVAITFIFALLVGLMFQVFPLLGLNNLQAQDSLIPMPTYDWDPINDKIFPDLSDPGYYDGHIFRTVECRIFLIVDIEDIQVFFEDTDWIARPFGAGIEDGETTVMISWIYRLFSQWPIYDVNSTFETIGSVSLGTLAVKSGVGPRFLIFADVRSPENSVDLINAIIGDGIAEASRKGHLDMAFKSKSKPNKEGALKFMAMVKEPDSGLKINVDATLPEGQESVRHVSNPQPVPILYIDLSQFPIAEGRPFKWWAQMERYEFDETMQTFELKVNIPGKILKLPGERVLPVKRARGALSLSRNVEGYAQFVFE